MQASKPPWKKLFLTLLDTIQIDMYINWIIHKHVQTNSHNITTIVAHRMPYYHPNFVTIYEKLIISQ